MEYSTTSRMGAVYDDDRDDDAVVEMEASAATALRRNLF